MLGRMTKIRAVASFEKRAERLEDVRQAYIAFRREAENTFSYKTDDCRMTFLHNIISLTRGTVILNLAFHRCSVDNEFGMRFFKLEDLSSLGPQVRNMSKYTRLSWCVMFQFQFENLARNILKELGLTVPSGYYKVTEKLVDRLSLPNRLHTIRRLNILANIRNSLHNNGIHKSYDKKDTIVQIDNIQYKFMHLKTVKCANWDHISHAWKGLLPTIRKIYFHSDVAKLKKIPNHFIS
jgi:hypothetical protein